MDIALEILRPVSRILTVHFAQKLRYFTSCTTYVKKMKDQMVLLKAQSDDVTNHIDAHNISSMETPADVRIWLKAVEDIKKVVESIPTDNIGCSNMKRRYQVGIKACNATKSIDNLIKQNPGTTWHRIPRALGKVYSKQGSTSASSLPPSSGGDGQSDFNSRDKPFNEALKFLQQDDTTQVIALCGMGGVGKTTMMERLRKDAEDKKMFNQIVKAVIGRDRDLLSVQRDSRLHRWTFD